MSSEPVVSGLAHSIAHGLTAGCGGAAGTTLTTGLVSWWTLDEASGTRNDSHGSNHLTDNNTVGQGAGKISNCADFEQDNSEWLEKASPTGLGGGDRDFTVSLWVKPETDWNNEGVISLGDPASGAAADHDWLFFCSTTRYKFLCGVGALFKTADSGVTSDAAGGWKHLVSYYDSTNDEISIVVDDDTPVTTTGVTAPNDTGNSMLFGRYNTTYADGLMDEVGFWSRLLTAAEITELYNSGAGIGYPG